MYKSGVKKCIDDHKLHTCKPKYETKLEKRKKKKRMSIAAKISVARGQSDL